MTILQLLKECPITFNVIVSNNTCENEKKIIIVLITVVFLACISMPIPILDMFWVEMPGIDSMKA